MASTSSPIPPPLLLIIRFSLPIADLPVSVPSPSITTPQTLAHLYIRPHLPSNYAACPLRLIASGALLPQKTPFSNSLRLPKPPSQPPQFTNAPFNASDKGKGKAPAPRISPPPPSDPSPIYIHCALTTTTTLSPSDLSAEAAAATPTSPPSPSFLKDASPPLARTPSAPLGFDRLPSSGFSPTEIAALRSQFLTLQSHTHTPDTMPSASELRVLEERWLDSGAFADGSGGGGDGVGGWEDEGGGLEDMLWGNVMGFFWAVGSVFWLVREEGVWTRRRKWAVATGVVANLLVGLLRGS